MSWRVSKDGKIPNKQTFTTKRADADKVLVTDIVVEW